MWALGTCIHAMLLGFFPSFKVDVDGSSGAGKVHLNPDSGLSPRIADLLSELLDEKPWQRPTATQAMRHRWFVSQVSADEDGLHRALPGLHAAVRSFVDLPPFR